MSGSFEANFIPETIEQTPFADSPAQIFFAKWCRINDSISPQFISREKWQQRGAQGLLEKMAQGKQKLFLPKDLHLWEMMDIINSVDHDTFARKPEKSDERAEQIKELGEIFEKAGIYLTEYIPELQEDDITAKEIAQVIAEEFYRYGLSLQHKEIEKDGLSRALQLSKEDKAKLDEWFLGRDAYQKRLSRLTEDPTNEEIEDTRKKILRVYFKALAREGYKADGEKPWETTVGPMQHIQDRATRQIIKAIETPKREMKTAIYSRGVEKLVTEMKEVTTETKERDWRKSINKLLQAIGFDPLLEQRRLYDALHIDELKQELEAVRKSGDIEKISAKELEIARII